MSFPHSKCEHFPANGVRVTPHSTQTVHQPRNGTDDYSIETASPYRSFFRRPFGAPIPNLLTLNLERSSVSGSPDPAQACKSSAGGNGAPSRVPARPGTITLPAVTHYQAGSHWTMPPWQASWPRSGYISLRSFCGWKTFGHITLPAPPAFQGFLFWLASQSCIFQALPHLELKHTNHTFRNVRALPRRRTLNTLWFDLCEITPGLTLMDRAIKWSCCSCSFFQANDDTSCCDSSLALWSVPHGGTREGNLFYLPLTPYSMKHRSVHSSSTVSSSDWQQTLYISQEAIMSIIQ